MKGFRIFEELYRYSGEDILKLVLPYWLDFVVNIKEKQINNGFIVFQSHLGRMKIFSNQ